MKNKNFKIIIAILSSIIILLMATLINCKANTKISTKELKKINISSQVEEGGMSIETKNIKPTDSCWWENKDSDSCSIPLK